MDALNSIGCRLVTNANHKCSKRFADHRSAISLSKILLEQVDGQFRKILSESMLLGKAKNESGKFARLAGCIYDPGRLEIERRSLDDEHNDQFETKSTYQEISANHEHLIF